MAENRQENKYPCPQFDKALVEQVLSEIYTRRYGYPVTFRLVPKEEPVKLVTEMLGGPQAETVKEEPVKLVTEMLGGPQAETVKEKEDAAG